MTFVPLVGVDFGDAESEEGQREEFKCVLERGAVGNFRQQRVLRSGFGVGWALEGAEGSFD